DGARAAGAGFDVALICLVLEHLEAVGPALEAAAAALAPAGRLLILELHPALHERRVGANFEVAGAEGRPPSVRHDAAELVAAAIGLHLIHALDHAPAERALARSGKLARYRGQPVLLEVAFEKPI